MTDLHLIPLAMAADPPRRILVTAADTGFAHRTYAVKLLYDVMRDGRTIAECANCSDANDLATALGHCLKVPVARFDPIEDDPDTVRVNRGTLDEMRRACGHLRTEIGSAQGQVELNRLCALVDDARHSRHLGSCFCGCPAAQRKGHWCGQAKKNVDW